jgi:glycosyltransferase involved in cell wall biosynthesis
MEEESSDLKGVGEAERKTDLSNPHAVVSLNQKNEIKKRGSRNGQVKSRIHLLQIVGNAIVGGTETYVYNLVSNLSPESFRVTCLCPFESPFTESLRRVGCDVFITPMDEEIAWNSIQLAVELARHHAVDLIHAHLPNAHILAGLVGKLTGTPVVSTIHSRYLCSEQLAISRMTETNLLLICQEAYGQALALGIPPERLTHIQNGVDLKRFTPERSRSEFRAALGIPLDAPLIGFVGRLEWEKGPDNFVRLAERVLSRRPDAHFALVGEGSMEAELEEMIAPRGLSKRIHLAGVWRNIAQVYPAFDLLAQTSRSEGMPLALLEAMACGLPVVAMDVGGVAEAVEVGVNGLICRRNDLDWMARKIIEILDEPETLKMWGRAARKRAEKLFDLRVSVERTAALFERLAAGRKKASVTLLAKNGNANDSARRSFESSLRT